MDPSLTLIFATCAGLALAGALAAALAPDMWRAPALIALAAGTAGALAALGAGLAALIALIALGVSAPLLAEAPRRRLRPAPATVAAHSQRLAAQLGAATAGLILLLFAFAALRGDFLHSAYIGGPIGAAALGRLLFGHDALAADAVAGLVLIGLVSFTWSGLRRR